MEIVVLYIIDIIININVMRLQTMTNAKVKLMEGGFNPGDPFPVDETIKDGRSLASILQFMFKYRPFCE